jgi:hypothetical protein
MPEAFFVQGDVAHAHVAAADVAPGCGCDDLAAAVGHLA